MTNDLHRQRIFDNARADIEAALASIDEAAAISGPDTAFLLKSALGKLWRATRALQTEKDVVLREFPEVKQRSRWDRRPAPTTPAEPLDDALPEWAPYTEKPK